MSENVTGMQGSLPLDEAQLHKTLKKSKRWNKVWGLAFPGFFVGIVLLNLSDHNDNGAFAFFGGLLVIVSIILLIVSAFGSQKQTSRAVGQILDAYDTEMRRARGNASMFADWEVRELWRTWNEHLEQLTTADPLDATKTDFDFHVLDCKQIALQEVATLAKDNDHVTLKEWHDHMVTVVAHMKEEAQTEMARDPSDEGLRVTFETNLQAMTRVVEEIRQSYAL